jgi:hypothetical protein
MDLNMDSNHEATAVAEDVDAHDINATPPSPADDINATPPSPPSRTTTTSLVSIRQASPRKRLPPSNMQPQSTKNNPSKKSSQPKQDSRKKKTTRPIQKKDWSALLQGVFVSFFGPKEKRRFAYDTLVLMKAMSKTLGISIPTTLSLFAPEIHKVQGKQSCLSSTRKSKTPSNKLLISVDKAIKSLHTHLVQHNTLLGKSNKHYKFVTFEEKIKERLSTTSLALGLLGIALHPTFQRTHPGVNKRDTPQSHTKRTTLIFQFYEKVAETQLHTRKEFDAFLLHVSLVVPILDPKSIDYDLWDNVSAHPQNASFLLRSCYEGCKTDLSQETELENLSRYKEFVFKACAEHVNNRQRKTDSTLEELKFRHYFCSKHPGLQRSGEKGDITTGIQEDNEEDDPSLPAATRKKDSLAPSIPNSDDDDDSEEEQSTANVARSKKRPLRKNGQEDTTVNVGNTIPTWSDLASDSSEEEQVTAHVAPSKKRRVAPNREEDDSTDNVGRSKKGEEDITDNVTLYQKGNTVPTLSDLASSHDDSEEEEATANVAAPNSDQEDAHNNMDLMLEIAGISFQPPISTFDLALQSDLEELKPVVQVEAGADGLPFYLIQSPLEIYRLPHLKTRQHRATYMHKVKFLAPEQSSIVVSPDTNYMGGDTLVLRQSSIYLQQTKLKALLTHKNLSSLLNFMLAHGQGNPNREGSREKGTNGWRYNFGCGNHCYVKVDANGDPVPNVPIKKIVFGKDGAGDLLYRHYRPCWWTGRKKLQTTDLFPFLASVMDETQIAVDLADRAMGHDLIFNDTPRNARFSAKFRQWLGAACFRFECCSIQLKCYHPSHHDTLSHLDEYNDDKHGYHYTVAFCCVILDSEKKMWSIKVRHYTNQRQS